MLSRLALSPTRSHVRRTLSMPKSSALSSSAGGVETLVELSPPRLTRLPLHQPHTPWARAFEESAAGRIDAYREQFRLSWDVAALRVPARDAGRAAKEARLAPFLLRVPKMRPILPDEQSKEHRLALMKVLLGSADEKSKEAAERAGCFAPSVPQELKSAVKALGWELTKSKLELDYEYWSAEHVLASLLPTEMSEGTPTAFTTVGHIAHLNLRDEYLPYRFIIGGTILDKNPGIRTVVNKLDSIDEKFRFFKMELLAGEADYQATVSESDCKFTFDFRAVYWNSRLHSEHSRLVAQFPPSSVLCDVMAGVGPFALPAARNGTWVLANDLNPASYDSLVANTEANRLTARIRNSCEDGRAYIRSSVLECWRNPFPGPAKDAAEAKKAVRSNTQINKEARAKREAALKAGLPVPPREKDVERWPTRKLIDAFVMNLPASALEFLDAYRGTYKALQESVGREALNEELDRREKEESLPRFPMVHVHCFTKDLIHPHEDVCARANEALGLTGSQRLIPPRSKPPVVARTVGGAVALAQNPEALAKLSLASSDEAATDTAAATETEGEGGEPTPEVSLHLVRSVAPNKDMYCLTFRLPRCVLYDEPEA